jgi:hypothetical protein
MAREHDYISEIIKQGAFVLPPPKPKPPAPVAVIEEVVTEPISIELFPPTESLPHTIEESPGVKVLADELEMHWKDPTGSQPLPETYHADVSEIVPDIGETITAVVVMWDAVKKFGFARRLGETGNPKGRRDGLYFSTADISTTGEETLRPGSMISGTVAEPRQGHKDRRLIDVEIFKV